jgi:hypothetical protein
MAVKMAADSARIPRNNAACAAFSSDVSGRLEKKHRVY